MPLRAAEVDAGQRTPAGMPDEMRKEKIIRNFMSRRIQIKAKITLPGI